MATASIQSLRNGITPITDASRDDLVVGDVVTLSSVNAGTAYQWSIAFKPEGSTAVFSSTGTESAIIQNPGTFTVDKDGPYLIRLAFTDGTGTTEQYVRLRALTDFGDLKLVAAGERYDTLRVPVDITASGWADEQNYNLNTLLGLIQSNNATGRVLYVDPENGDYQTIQAAMDAANAAVPTLTEQWVVLVRPGIYTEDLTFYRWVNVFGWPGGERSSLVRVRNNTVASHTVNLIGAGHTLVLCNLFFEQPVVSPNPVISQSGLGSLTVLRSEIETQGAGEAFSTTSSAAFYDCIFKSSGGGATDYVIRCGGAITLNLFRCEISGPSGLFVDTQAQAFLRDSFINVSGTYTVNTVGVSTQVEYSKLLGGAFVGNPTASGAPGDLAISVQWSQVENISLDGTNVVGTASLNIGASAHGVVSTAGGAALTATIPADTIFYDNTTTGIAAENVQDAIDEVYAFAALIRTLDDAYDGGVAASGSGRTIIADAGAVQIVDAPAPSDPIPAGNTNGNLEVVGSVKLGAINKPEITVDPNPFGNGPEVLLGREIWANDAPFGSTALILGDASGNPTYHNYNLRVGTQAADGGNQVGSLYLRAGDSLTTIDAGSVYLQAGTATDAGGGVGGDIYIAPGETAAGGAGSMILVNPLTATSATLTAAGAFVGGVSGDITFGTEMGAVTIPVLAGDSVAVVRGKITATGVLTAVGDPIVISTVAKGATAEVFYLDADAGVDAAVGGFSGQAMVPGTWPDTVSVGVTGTTEITFGAGDPNPMIYDSTTGKLTVPGLIDPTGLIFDEAGVPPTAATQGGVFVSDGSGGLVQNELYYVDGTGTTFNLMPGGGGISLQGAYNGGNTIVTAGATNIDFTLTSGNFIVTGGGAVAFGSGIEVSSFSVFSAGTGTFQTRDTTLIEMQANNAAARTLTVRASNAGAGAGNLTFRVDDLVTFDSAYMEIAESAPPAGSATANHGRVFVADNSDPAYQDNGLYYVGDSGAATRLNAPSLDRHHINMPEAPNDTVEYRGWASYPCVLRKVKVYNAVTNTNGTYTLTITNNATGNTVLNAATFNMNTLVADTVTSLTPLTGTASDLVFAEDDRWTVSLVSNDATMNASGVYIDLTFEVT